MTNEVSENEVLEVSEEVFVEEKSGILDKIKSNKGIIAKVVLSGVGAATLAIAGMNLAVAGIGKLVQKGATEDFDAEEDGFIETVGFEADADSPASETKTEEVAE